jgi:glutamate-1-semialdehyde 2,1-aminomutase
VNPSVAGTLATRIFELPLNLKRSHVSYAHRPQHVDELIASTEIAARSVLAGRAQPDPGASR